jgi:hypothetical protein
VKKKLMMHKQKYTDEEIRLILDKLSEQLDDPEEFINNAFESLLFLGDSLKNDTEDLVEVNLRLCQAYYQRVENYERLKQLRDFALSLEKEKKVKVDTNIINNLILNLN